VNRDVHWRRSKRRRKWRVFLEENKKLVQINDDHPEIDKTWIHTGGIKRCILVLTGYKLTLVRRCPRGTI
jgi:hypothetical protein